MVWVPNKVLLISRGRHEEGVTAVACYPGMVLTKNSSGLMIPHNVVGGPAIPLMVAKEEALRGATINQVIPIGDPVPYQVAANGDLFTMLLKNGQNVVNQTPLMSGGDGTLVAGLSDKLFQIVAPSSTVHTTNVETTFSNGTYTIPANTLAVGDVIRIRAKMFCISVNATPTHTLKAYLGATAVANSGAISMIAGDVIIFDIYLTIRTIGASGTYIGTAQMSSWASGVVTNSTFTLASTAIDTTATQAITIKVTPSASHASNQVRLDEYQVNADKAGGLNILGYAQEAVDNSAGTGTSDFNTAKLIRVLVP